METIDAIFKQSGYLLDPHSAVGMKVAREVNTLTFQRVNRP